MRHDAPILPMPDPSRGPMDRKARTMQDQPVSPIFGTPQPNLVRPAPINRIILFPGADAWYAKYCGPEADRIRDLFGTDTLPTAFTIGASADTVRETIARLNPESIVIVKA